MSFVKTFLLYKCRKTVFFYITQFIFIITLIVFFSGCITAFKPKRAAGKTTEVIVISSETMDIAIDSLLSSILEKVIYTPTMEQIFNIKRVIPHNFSQFRYRKNCLMIGLVGEQFIDSILTQESMQKLLSGESYIFGADNLFVRGQQFLVISAPTIYKLKEVLETNNTLIFNYFAEGIRKMFREILFKDGYQEDKTEELKAKYGWRINIPNGWNVVEDRFGFVSYVRYSPHRIISIYWETSPTFNLSRKGAIAMRNAIATKYYDGDYIDTTMLSFYPVSFNNLTAGKLEGIWQNDSLTMGGPFTTYIFSSKGRTYAIDMHIYAPGEKKWKWLQQLEIIAETFTDN